MVHRPMTSSFERSAQIFVLAVIRLDATQNGVTKKGKTAPKRWQVDLNYLHQNQPTKLTAYRD